MVTTSSFCASLPCQQRFLSGKSFISTKSLIRGGFAPRSDPLPFFIPFLAEKLPLSYTFHWKIMKGPFKYLNERFPYPFIYFDLRNPYPFIYLKRYPFRAEPPRIGHYREYPPPPPPAFAYFVNRPTTSNTRGASDFLHTKRLARKKPLLAGWCITVPQVQALNYLRTTDLKFQKFSG